MTEQEAEVWVARLTRIWTTEHSSIPKDWRLYDTYFTFYFDVSPDVEIAIFISEEFGVQATLRYSDFEIGCDSGHFSEDYALCEEEEWPLFKRFAVRWMDSFRRGCWLSGCPIEASAHEKAEWMRDFTAKEINAWDLKV